MPTLHRHSAWLLLPCMLLVLASESHAQAASAAVPAALPTRLHYLSPLHLYKPYADQPVEPWRDANDRVGRIGGWRAYTKEAQAGAPASAPAGASASASASAPASAPAVAPAGASARAPAVLPAAAANPHADHRPGGKP